MLLFFRKIGKRRQTRRWLRNQKKKARMKLKKRIMKMMNLTRKVECTNSHTKKTDHTVIRFYRIKNIVSIFKTFV